MASVEDGIAAQIRNIEARYGRPLPEWFGIIAASGLTKHTEVVAMLKADYGMAHGAAHRVSLLSRQAAVPDSALASGQATASDPAAASASRASPGEVADALYAGKKASLRPLHDQLMAHDPRHRSGREPGPQEGVRQPAPPEEAVRHDPAQRGRPHRPRPDPARRPSGRPPGACRQFQWYAGWCDVPGPGRRLAGRLAPTRRMAARRRAERAAMPRSMRIVPRVATVTGAGTRCRARRLGAGRRSAAGTPRSRRR